MPITVQYLFSFFEGTLEVARGTYFALAWLTINNQYLILTYLLNEVKEGSNDPSKLLISTN